MARPRGLTRWLKSCLLLCTSVLTGCISLRQPPIQHIDVTAHTIAAQSANLAPQLVRLALVAYNHAYLQGYTRQPILTIIDFSQASEQPRFWVINLQQQRILYQTWVAHGKMSGERYAHYFSNHINSMASSIGLYQTAVRPYMGRFGYSLRLKGLDVGYNDHAAARAIVIHGADYVSSSYIKTHGQLGVTWGCPALPINWVKPIINTIKGQSLIFAYYPDVYWLQHSVFLKS